MWLSIGRVGQPSHKSVKAVQYRADPNSAYYKSSARRRHPHCFAVMNLGGLGLTLLGGLIAGTYTALIRAVPGWKWEHFWTLYALFGLVVFPWIYAVSTLSGDQLLDAWRSADAATWAAVLLFGAGWGGGSVTFGLGVAVVGNSLGFSLILGLCATLGSIIPLLVFHASDATKKTGIFDFIALSITIVGLVLVGYAGTLKSAEQHAAKEHGNKTVEVAEKAQLLGAVEREAESAGIVHAADVAPSAGHGGSVNGQGTTDGDALVDQAEVASEAAGKSPSFLVGLILCFASGILSAFLNLSLTFGAPMSDAAEKAGAPKTQAPNAVWVLGLLGGFVTNAAYTLYLVGSGGSWGMFCRCCRGQDAGQEVGPGGQPLRWFEAEAGSLQAWAYAIMSGAAWYFGTSIYGNGQAMLGPLGSTVGWPVFLIAQIIAGNAVGVIWGEWAGSEMASRLWMLAGVLVLCVAIVVVSLG